MSYPKYIETTHDRDMLEGRPDHGSDDILDQLRQGDLERAADRAAVLRAASVDYMTPLQSRVTRRASRWPEPPARRFTGAELGFLVSAIALTVAWIAFLAACAWLVFGG